MPTPIKRAEEACSAAAEIRKRREQELSSPLGYCVSARGMDWGARRLPFWVGYKSGVPSPWRQRRDRPEPLRPRTPERQRSSNTGCLELGHSFPSKPPGNLPYLYQVPSHLYSSEPPHSLQCSVLSLQYIYILWSFLSIFKIGFIFTRQRTPLSQLLSLRILTMLTILPIHPTPPQNPTGAQLRAPARGSLAQPWPRAHPSFLLRCCIQADLLLHQLVPVPGGWWELLPRRHRPLPVHPCHLQLCQHKQQWDRHLGVEWRDALWHIEHAQEQVGPLTSQGRRRMEVRRAAFRVEYACSRGWARSPGLTSGWRIGEPWLKWEEVMRAEVRV